MKIKSIQMEQSRYNELASSHVQSFFEFQKHREQTIAERFDEYHRDNPHVFAMFRRYSEQAMERGFRKFSAKAIFERMRWYYQMETSGTNSS